MAGGTLSVVFHAVVYEVDIAPDALNQNSRS